LTGFITSTIAWDGVLEQIFSNQVNGVDCVLEATTTTDSSSTSSTTTTTNTTGAFGVSAGVYTYHISNGVATLKYVTLLVENVYLLKTCII